MNAARLVTCALVLVVCVSSTALGDMVFGTPTPLAAPINDEYLNWKPSISADGLTLYWASTTQPRVGDLDLWMATRATTTDPWGNRTSLGPTLNTTASESEPSISADGLELYFARGTAGNARDTYDIWVAKRPSVGDPWNAPQKLSAMVNSDVEDADPSISSDGLELYFDSNRSGGDFSIWVASRASTAEEFGAPEMLPDTLGYGFANISADGLMLFSGDSQALSLFVQTRASTSDPFGPRTALDGINGPFEDYDGFLSPDGQTFYFSSTRPGVPTGQEFGENGIWQAAVVPEPAAFPLALLAMAGLRRHLRRPARSRKV